jgi:hypothetical protein
VNWTGAAAALFGYVVAIPLIGVAGAILATAVAHALRVALFLSAGRRSAPISYPWRGAVIGGGALIVIALLKPVDADLAQDLVWAAGIILPLSIILLRAAIAFAPARGLRHAA